MKIFWMAVLNLVAYISNTETSSKWLIEVTCSISTIRYDILIGCLKSCDDSLPLSTPFWLAVRGHVSSLNQSPCRIRRRWRRERRRRVGIPWIRWTWSSRWRSSPTSWSASRAERSCPAAGPRGAGCSSRGSGPSWTPGWWTPRTGRSSFQQL